MDLMEDPRQHKQTANYLEEVQAQIPVIVEPARNDASLLPNALEQLLAWEKKTRKAGDIDSSKEIVKAVLELLLHHNDWKSLGEHVALLCKRHAQLHEVIINVVQTAMTYLEKTPDETTKVELIDTLREVSKGKMMVELEFARLSKMKSQLEETREDISAAASTLEEVQVETVGSMELEEKCEFLLEQFRLTMANKDYIRAELIMRKVNPNKLKDSEKSQALKLKYFELQIQYFKYNSDFLETCKANLKVFELKKKEPDAWREPLKNAVMFIAMAPFDSEVSDIRHRLKTEKLLTKIETCKTILDLLTTDELMKWPLGFADEWKSDEVFSEEEDGDVKMSDAEEKHSAAAVTDTAGVDQGTSPGERRWAALKKSVIQHNIRVVSKYYTRITSQRLAFLLQLSEQDTEKYLSEMVQSKQMFAKIDRPSQIIVFARRLDADATLNEWATDISKLLTKVDQCCHMIAKENMMYGIKA